MASCGWRRIGSFQAGFEPDTIEEEAFGPAAAGRPIIAVDSGISRILLPKTDRLTDSEYELIAMPLNWRDNLQTY